MTTSIRFALALVAACSVAGSLAGCGGGSGGGGGGDDGGLPPASYTMVPLAPAALVGISTICPAIDGVNGQQGGARFTTTADVRALIWSGSADSLVDIGPGEINGMDDGVQFGNRGLPGTSSETAALWMGSEASFVNLEPPSMYASSVAGGDATTQVGRVRPAASMSHAALWQGSVASFVDLHPAGYDISRCYDGHGDVQVGSGRLTSDGTSHALLWRGTAASVVDLGVGFAWGASADEQVGSGPGAHAYLWRGTQASGVDLHPAGFTSSVARGAANGKQVGSGDANGGNFYALVWQGSAASATNLHSTTQGYMIEGAPPLNSTASDIDSAGNIVGQVFSISGRPYAVMWVPN